MDPSQYHANGLSNHNNNNNQYTSLPGISPQQLQQGSSLPPHTLPPLQASGISQQHVMNSMYGGSAPHTPRTPATPGTPGSATMGNFPQMQPQSRPYQIMPGNGNGYQQQNQVYRTSGSMMQPSSTAMSHTPMGQPTLAPRPQQQPLRPLQPTNGMQHMQGGMQSYGQNHHMLQQQMQDMEPPTHVVGSQGRRGILPSAPGRPPVSASATATGKNAMIPAKDADGKFPCPHCTKTYLHAKHLKRHLLRHTGDRPYMCVLCRDTFSRSDILKRHFQKCSIRRGNPTGASHLSHAQAHLKKSHPGPKSSGSISNENDIMGNGMGNFGIVPDGTVPDAGSNMTDEQAGQLRRIGGGDGRNSMTGPSPVGSNRGSFDQNYGGIASTMPTGMNLPPASSTSNGQNGHSYGQGPYDYVARHVTVQSNPDWSQIFQQPSVAEGLYPMHSYYQNIPSPHASIKTEPYPIKSEASLNNPTSISGDYQGVYPSTSNGAVTTSSMPFWSIQDDPLQEISNRLSFCCFPNNQIIGRNNDIRKYLSASNIKHFLECYTSFQGHFPVLHVPTFRIAEAFDGLLLGMICIGAVYSDRLTSTQAREMMELAKSVIERNSPIYSIVSREQTRDSGFGDDSNVTSNFGSTKLDLEQITAIFLMQVLFTWHGTPLQREKARQEFPVVAEIAKRAGLTKPMTPQTQSYSVLHQPNVTVEDFNAARFNWHSWIEQEKRSRLMYALFLTDAAMALYFNIAPKFEKDEVRLPLPADDAAWDASTAVECSEALGLHGAVVARSRNASGSRRPKQPEMHSALQALMQSNCDLQPGTTNIYSKFILVHALQIQLWTTLQQISLQESGQHNGNLSYPSSGATTPISQHDWVRGIESNGSGAVSASTSRRATPVEGFSQSSLLKVLNNAFDKWKKAWDEDMASQFPPSSTQYRRFGFCRDAVHFYWLAKFMMKNPRGMNWKTAPDQRFSHVINLLKSVKTWVVSDRAKRGEELGSVSDLGSDYGVTDLTLDMAQLFRPINKEIDSPVSGVHTSIGMV